MIDITKFCDTSRERPHFNRPFKIGAHTYASNGYCAIRLQLMDGIEPGTDAVARVAAILACADDPSIHYVPLPVFSLPLASRPICGDCGGAGYVRDCPDCDGQGHHECARASCTQTHDCPDCDGNGTVAADAASGTGCPECNGTGAKLDSRRLVPADGCLFQAWIWNLLASLPGIEVEDPIHSGIEKPLLFRWDGGHAAMAGMLGTAKPHDIRPVHATQASRAA